MRYAIVIEQAAANYSAYVPDLPGCVATGSTLEEVEEQIFALPDTLSLIESLITLLWTKATKDNFLLRYFYAIINRFCS